MLVAVNEYTKSESHCVRTMESRMMELDWNPGCCHRPCKRAVDCLISVSGPFVAWAMVDYVIQDLQLTLGQGDNTICSEHNTHVHTPLMASNLLSPCPRFPIPFTEEPSINPSIYTTITEKHQSRITNNNYDFSHSNFPSTLHSEAFLGTDF